MAAVIRVALADDYQPVRAALRRLFENEPDMQCVGEASDGIEAIELVASLAVDVLMLDLGMPRMSGWQALPKIRVISPSTHVVVFSIDVDPWIRQKAMEMGARECLHKGAEPSVIVEAVRSVAAWSGRGLNARPAWGWHGRSPGKSGSFRRMIRPLPADRSGREPRALSDVRPWALGRPYRSGVAS